jgi:asparagine synthase (glutamine-hydrolysing)
MDRMSMAHSLEARSPFLDQELVQFAAFLPEECKQSDGVTKYLLKRAFSDILPKEIRRRSKKGFAVPLDKWFRHELYDFARDVLLSIKARQRGFFRADTIERMIAEHKRNQADHSHRIWSLLVIELWQQQFIDRSLQGASPAPRMNISSTLELRYR